MSIGKNTRISKGQSFSAYRKAKGLNYHTLADWDKAPILTEMEQDDKPAMQFGRAAHTYILEGVKAFQKEWTVVDCATRNNNKFKDTEGEKVTSPEFDQIFQMNKAVREHKAASKLLLEGDTEVGIYWEEIIGETNIQMKARLDKVNETRRIIPDLKTTDDASRQVYSNYIAKYGLGKQLAYYQRAALAAFDNYFAPVLVVIEKKPPHLISIFMLDGDSQEKCREWVQDKLEDYSQWLQVPKAKRVMGYPEEIQEITLPPWAFK